MSYDSLGRGAHLMRRGWIVPAVAGLFIVVAADARADNEGSGNVVAIEEDWELIVKEPDEETQAPQVSCIIAPNDDGVFATFNLNHKSFPQYDAGGLHLQTWQGNAPLDSAQFPNDALLTTANETVTWTMRMHIQEGQIWFEVVAGSSATWGNFGGTGTLKSSHATELTNLNQYEPSDSAANSGVGYAGNRVTSLKLKAVRKLLKSGDVVEDNQTRTVYPQD